MITTKIKKPILKWAGGKTKVLEILKSHFDLDAQRFVEPFFGSGVVFLNVEYPEYLISDINQDLYNLYQQTKVNPQLLISRLTQLFNNCGKNSYYQRRQEFNDLTEDNIEKAALFVYLNKNCFNGLCRYNSKGKFNTSHCAYKTAPNVPACQIISMHKKLKKVDILCVDFREVFAQCKSGDLVYCDPPYLPLNQITFTKYSKQGFSHQDHLDLASLARQAARNGACVIISNHDTPAIRAIYPGAKIHSIQVSRFMKTDGSRKLAGEIIVVYKNLR